VKCRQASGRALNQACSKVIISRMQIEADQISQIIAKYPVEYAYLYGSFAEKTNRPWSDLDIALIVAGSFPPAQYSQLEIEISKEIDQLSPGINSDVRIFNQAPLNYQIQVVQNGKLIFCRDETGRVNFETKVRSEYFDFLPLKKEYRSAMFQGIKEGGLLWSIRKK